MFFTYSVFGFSVCAFSIYILLTVTLQTDKVKRNFFQTLKLTNEPFNFKIKLGN